MILTVNGQELILRNEKKMVECIKREWTSELIVWISETAEVFPHILSISFASILRMDKWETQKHIFPIWIGPFGDRMVLNHVEDLKLK